MITNEQLKKMIAIADGYRDTGYATELATELLAARERIAELEAAQRWIPVSERTPESPDDYVLMYDPDDEDGTIFTGEWRVVDKGIIDTITHWMPLPEPPEVSA